MSMDEFAEAMRPFVQRMADWVAETLPKIDAAITAAGEQFADDVESWLRDLTASNAARNATPTPPPDATPDPVGETSESATKERGDG